MKYYKRCLTLRQRAAELASLTPHMTILVTVNGKCFYIRMVSVCCAVPRCAVLCRAVLQHELTAVS
uniref:Uncharacterized protein n=1 Tax=Papilio polytes TaxID=76194 RepID=I4DN52_PAPPL|nr:unknown unsecreted protein [Papilio polytes]